MTFGWVTAYPDTRISDFYELVAAAFLNGHADPGATATNAHVTFTANGLTYSADLKGEDLTYDANGVPLSGVMNEATIRDAGGTDLLYLHSFDIQVAAVAAAAEAERLGYNPIAIETYIGTWSMMYFSYAMPGEALYQSQPIGPDDWAYEPTGAITLRVRGPSTLYLGSGSDWVEGSQFDDVILGGAGHDMIFTQQGVDIVTPGQGNDWTSADADDTIVFWGASTDFNIRAVMMGFLYVYVDDLRPGAPEGNDIIRADAVNLEFADVTLILSIQNGVPVFTPGVGVTINGTSGGDVLAPYTSPVGQPKATPFGDKLYGLGGNDVLDGGRGGDLMYGGAGNDTYYVDHMSDQAIETGGTPADGYDTVIADFDFALGDYVEALTLRGAARVGFGNALDNRIDGNDLGNFMGGLYGNDTIYGNAGDDEIYGGDGNDVIFGGRGRDYIEGNGGDDTLDGGTGDDALLGGEGADIFLFKASDFNSRDLVVGGNEDVSIDSLIFTTVGSLTASSLAKIYEVERVQLADGTNSATIDDSFVVQNPGVIIKGGSGNDTVDASALTAAHGITIASGTGDDTLKGGLGSDTFQFTILQLMAADIVQGGAGPALDWVQLTKTGTLAATALNGVSGIERLQLTGGGTNSITLTDIAAGANPDLIVKGGSGNDTVDATAVGATHRLSVVSGTGNDTLLGGAGADQFAFAVAELTSSDTVNGGAGTALDTLNFTTSGTIIAAALARISNLERLYLAGGAANTLTMDDAFAARNTALIVKGGAGNDTIDFTAFSAAHGMTVNSGSGNDTLKGGLGSDVFQFTLTDLTSADIVQGGNGPALDWLAVITAGAITASKLAGLSGIERLQLTTGTNTVTLSNAIAAANADLVVKGSGGSDTIDGTALSSANHVAAYGGVGTDTLKGGAGADVLSGEAGNDLIVGGLGADTLTGGADADTFQWLVRDGAATDRVTDFVAGTDKLSFSQTAFDFAGAGFDSRIATASTATSITGVDLVVYSGGPLNGTADAKAYLSAAAGGSANEGLFLFGTNSAGHSVLFHARDASFVSDDVAFVADLGLASAAAIQLGDFAFV